MVRRVVWALVLVAGAPFAAYAAGEVTISLNPDAQRFANQAGISQSALEMQITQETERLFQTIALKDYVRSFADAQAFTTRGLGVDYAAHPRLFMLGVAANVSINAEDGFKPSESRGRPPIGSLAPNFTVMGGVNLGVLGLRPVTLFGNYFKAKGDFEEFKSDLQNWGAHVQVKLFGPADDATLLKVLFRWGGIDITTGIDHARMGLGLGNTLKTDFPLNNGMRDYGRIDVESTGKFDLVLRTYNVPLEVTTNFRLLYFLSLYGGVGIDWQLGGSGDLTMNLDGRMTGTLTGGGGTFDLGTARVVATETAKPSAGRLRGIVGLQANLAVLRVFVQLNALTENPMLASIAFGVRLVF